MNKIPAAKSTFAIGGVSCSADSLVQGGSSVLRIILESFRHGENRDLRQAQKRYAAFYDRYQTTQYRENGVF